MKYHSIFLALVGLYACGGSTEQDEIDSEEFPKVGTEEFVQNNPNELYFLPTLPDTLKEVSKIFASNNHEIELEYYDQLELDPDNAPVGGYFTEGMFTTGNGFVFAVSTSMGASDLYVHHDYLLLFFDTAGEFMNVRWTPTFDSDVEVGIIQNEFIYIKNTYPEYVSDEEGFVMEASGDTLIKTDYYRTFPLSLEEVKGSSAEDLAIYRNSIYAKHGYIFKSEKYSEYFSTFDWYEPTLEDVDYLLSPQEKEFAEYLKQLEEEQ